MNSEQIINERDMYRTADLALASVLFMSFQLEAIDKQNSRKAYFIFLRSEPLDQVVEQYWKGEIKVEPQDYFNAMRQVKARLYGE